MLVRKRFRDFLEEILEPGEAVISALLEKQLRIMEEQELRAKTRLRHEQLCKEWKTVGFIADRLFLVITAGFCVITSTVVMLCLYFH